MSNILSKIINEEIDKIDSGIQELQNLIRSGVQAKNNILTPDGKNVYVIRACSKGEYDFVDKAFNWDSYELIEVNIDII